MAGRLAARLSGEGGARRRGANRERMARSSLRARLTILALLLVGGATAYMLWFRHSSFVAVNDVEVVGVTAGREPIVAELTEVGERMTTLAVDREQLERAALAFPSVAAIEVDPNFPHGLRLEISERPPAMVLGQETPVAADGTILTGIEPPADGVPQLEIEGADLAAKRLQGEALEQALVVGAAPDPIRPLIEAVELTKDFGIVITLRGGIPVRFGDESGAGAKWKAIAAVLADPKLDSLTYLDVRVPERPAVGGNPT